MILYAKSIFCAIKLKPFYKTKYFFNGILNKKGKNMQRYDLIVVGGGFAGVGSAISAAREGAKVLLVEEGNALGGSAVNMLVNPFMPTTTKLNDEMVDFSQGIFSTIKQKLIERGALEKIAF